MITEVLKSVFMLHYFVGLQIHYGCPALVSHSEPCTIKKNPSLKIELMTMVHCAFPVTAKG